MTTTGGPEATFSAGPGAVLAIDPGKEKCGLSVLSSDGAAIELEITARGDAISRVAAMFAAHNVAVVVVGHATGRMAIVDELQAVLPAGIAVAIVDEAGSTLEARSLYWAVHPRRGWRRLLPLSLQVPPVPIDDFAAVVLGRRYLQGGG